MSTTVEKISSNKVKLSFDIDAAQFDAAMDKAYIKVRGQVTIPGFRKGRAPRKMIENMYGGEGVFYDEAFELIFDEVYGPAIDENKLEVVDRPQVDIQQIGTGKNLQFTCEVFVKPDVTLGEYKGVEVKREHTLVTEDEVNAEIEKERNKQAAEVSVDNRAVAEGDTVNLDYSGSVDGVKFAGGTAEAQTLKIGSHTFIPGFEEQMVGMNIGDERDINVTFPEDYHAENLAGKPVVFKVKVHAITEENVPELNDEFVQDISECSTVDEYTAYVRGDLEKRAAERAKNERTDLILQKVIDNAEVEIHGDIVSAEVDMQIDRFDKQLQSFGADLKSYLEYAHLSIEDMRKDYEQAAQRQLKSQYVMMAIIDAEKLEPTDEDFREVIAMSDTAKQQHWDDEKIDAELKDNRMKYAVSALYNAAVKMLVANAVVPAAAPAEEAPAAE